MSSESEMISGDASESERPSDAAELVPPPRPADVVMPVESSYVDLDGDGVPDAVRTSQTRGFDVTGDGIADVVETIEELASDIDVAGVPRHVEVTDIVEADVGHDGTFEVVDVVTLPADRGEDRGSVRRERARRARVSREPLARARRASARMRRRHEASGVAATRVRPAALLEALERVAACLSPHGDVRVSVDPEAVGLAVHARHAGWWVATAIRARLRRGSPVAVTVDRDELQHALRVAAATHRRGVPLFVRRGEGIRVGAEEVRAVRELDREVSTPPHFESWEPIEQPVVVPRVDELAGETTFPFARGTVTTTNSLLRALTVLGVDRVAVLEDAGRVFLLGSTTEKTRSGRIVVAGEARLRYL